MESSTASRARRLAPLLAVLPLVAACGAGHGDDGGPQAAAMRPVVSTGTHLVITTDNGVRLRPADGHEVGLGTHVTHHWSHHGDTWVLDLTCDQDGDGKNDATDDDGDDDGDADGRTGTAACPRTPEIDVPSGASVTVNARNAGIDVAGLSSALDLTTVNGDVTVTRSGRDGAALRLVTRNGSVRTTSLRGATLHAETVNGDVVLTCASSPTTVSAATTNGSVRLLVPHGAPAYRVDATTDNGRPAISVPTEHPADGHTLTLTTVNGDVSAARE
jgi:hypothetical protein